MIKKVYLYFLGYINIFPFLRSFYWNLRANDIDEKWGDKFFDYELIGKIIDDYQINSVLDFGCGSGRLANLYIEKKIEKIIMYDLSLKAIKIAKIKNNNTSKINFVSGNISKLDLIENEVDLIISNKALSAVHKSDIKSVLEKLCKSSKYFYICEFNSPTGGSNYWFSHNYIELMEEFNFELIENPIDEEYLLFRKLNLL